MNNFETMRANIQAKFQYFDYYLFIPYIILCLIGVIMVYSASSVDLTYMGMATTAYMDKQLIYVVMGVLLLALMVHLNPRFWVNQKMINIGYWVVLGLLVFAKLLSRAVNGANGWINLGIINIQPSELCKLYLIMYLSYWFTKRQKKLQLGLEPVNMRRLYLKVGLLLFVILIEPDFGGTIINFMIVIAIYSASLSDSKQGLKVLGSVLALMFVGMQLFRFDWFVRIIKAIPKIGYVAARFQAQFTPFKLIQSSGKQLVNSLYAISNGGMFGLGLGNGIQKRGYLPEPHTDFILAVIAEELGAVGVLIVLGLLAWIIARIFLIGIRSKTRYNTLFCYGVGMFMLVETLFNVGAVNGLLPITGVTLPFVSYGGSSMLVLSMALGMVMNISANERRDNEVDLARYIK